MDRIKAPAGGEIIMLSIRWGKLIIANDPLSIFTCKRRNMEKVQYGCNTFFV